MYKTSPPRKNSRARALDRNRTNVKIVIDWLRYNFFEDKTKDGTNCGSLSKASVYNQYLQFCKVRGLAPATGPVFGKVVRMAFPDIKYCRKGTRSAAKHHYKYLVRRWISTEQETSNEDGGWSSEDESVRSGSDDDNKSERSPKDEPALVYDVNASNTVTPEEYPMEMMPNNSQERRLYLLPEESLTYNETGSFSHEGILPSDAQLAVQYGGQEDTELQHYFSGLLAHEGDHAAADAAQQRYFSASPLLMYRSDTPSLDDMIKSEKGYGPSFRPPTPFLDVLAATTSQSSSTSATVESQNTKNYNRFRESSNEPYTFLPSSPRSRKPEVQLMFTEKLLPVPASAMRRPLSTGAANTQSYSPSFSAPHSSVGSRIGLPSYLEVPITNHDLNPQVNQQTSEEISFFVSYEHYFRNLVGAVTDMKLNMVEGLTQQFWEQHGRRIQFTPENIDLMVKIDRYHYAKLADAAMSNRAGLGGASLSSVLTHFADFLAGSVERATATVLPPLALKAKLREVLSFSTVLKRRAQFVGGGC